MSDNNKNRFLSAVSAFLVTLLVITAGVSGYQIVTIMRSDYCTGIIYEEIQTEFHESGFVIAENRWDSIQKDYPGIVAWLSCPDTRLDYPVMQSRDNSYYLNHLADGSVDRHGALFLDYRNQGFSDSHCIIYGHNMNDGSMLSCLLNWRNAEYAANHPILLLSTPEQEYEVHIFNICVADPADSEVFDLTCAGAKADWLNRCAIQSWYTADFFPSAELPVLTLCTCADQTKRFIVQGVLVAL